MKIIYVKQDNVPERTLENEYHKYDKYVRDQNLLTSAENLEKALYRASEFKELSLFEDD